MGTGAALLLLCIAVIPLQPNHGYKHPKQNVADFGNASAFPPVTHCQVQREIKQTQGEKKTSKELEKGEDASACRESGCDC